MEKKFSNFGLVVRSTITNSISKEIVLHDVNLLSLAVIIFRCTISCISIDMVYFRLIIIQKCAIQTVIMAVMTRDTQNKLQDS